MSRKKKTASGERLKFMDTVEMSEGLCLELANIVKSSVEPAIRERAENGVRLTLTNTHNGVTIPDILEVVRMPQGCMTEGKSLGAMLRCKDNALQELLSFLKEKKAVQDMLYYWEFNSWENHQEYAYLCSCIDLIEYINRLINIGNELRFPVQHQKVFCSYCFRYAISEDIVIKKDKDHRDIKNIKFCLACCEVEGDGQDYKKAKRIIERFAELEGIPVTNAWMRLKVLQIEEMDVNLGELREVASKDDITLDKRLIATIGLINHLPRLKSVFINELSEQTFEELIFSLLGKMDYRYGGIKDYFLAHPEYLCGTLIRYDCYLLMKERLAHESLIKTVNRKKLVSEISKLLSRGTRPSAIIKELELKKSTAYKYIREAKALLNDKQSNS